MQSSGLENNGHFAKFVKNSKYDENEMKRINMLIIIASILFAATLKECASLHCNKDQCFALQVLLQDAMQNLYYLHSGDSSLEADDKCLSNYEIPSSAVRFLKSAH